MTLPVPADLPRLLRALAREEERERRDLARLEARLRRFEDVERPAYDAWLRTELGPVLSEVDELAQALRARRMLAERVTELVEDDGLHPREALWVLTEAPADGGKASGAERRSERAEREREEVEARRRAKRDRKRAERKEAKRAARRSGAEATTTSTRADEEGPARRRLTMLYRGLARSLHPDSPLLVRALAPDRLRSVWAEVQAAYAVRSLERLLALATWLEAVAASGVDAEAEARDGNRPARTGEFLSLGERHERLRALRRAGQALARRLETLAAEPAWDFPSAEPRLRRSLKQAAARRLAGDRDAMREALAAVDAFLDGIGPPRPPRAPGRRGRR